MTLPLAALIVNYRAEQRTCHTLTHLLALGEETPEEIIVIDLNRYKVLADAEELKHPRVTYHPLDVTAEQRSIPHALNVGMHLSDQEWLVVLDPSAHPEPGCLTGLIDKMRTHSRIHVAGPRLAPFVYYADSEVSALNKEPGLWFALTENSPLRHIFKPDKRRLKFEILPTVETRTMDCAAISGQCMMLHRPWLVQHGGFDDKKFETFFWDRDLCHRIRADKGHVYYCPEFLCRVQREEREWISRARNRRWWRNYYQYYRKRNGLLYGLLLRSVIIKGLLSEFLLLSIRNMISFGRDEVIIMKWRKMKQRLGDQFNHKQSQG